MDSGTRAEDAAERYLVRRGWYPIARNWRCRAGELDVVVRRLGVLAVVEVKARGDPAALLDPVTERQRRRIMRATEALVARNPELGDLALRFDVITVDLSGRRRRITHLPDAFRPPDPRTGAACPRRDTRSTGRTGDGWA